MEGMCSRTVSIFSLVALLLVSDDLIGGPHKPTH